MAEILSILIYIDKIRGSFPKFYFIHFQNTNPCYLFNAVMHGKLGRLYDLFHHQHMLHQQILISFFYNFVDIISNGGNLCFQIEGC